MKILVAGNVNGRIKSLFSKVNNVLKKTGQFDMLLCVGTFFLDTPECVDEWEPYKTVPLPTFLMGPTAPELSGYYDDISADGGELCTNVTCLGQRGLYTTSAGLQIAYLSGCYDNRQYKSSESRDKMSSFFTQRDVAALIQEGEREGYKGVDILLTSEWPQGVTNEATPPEGADVARAGSLSVARMVSVIKPRYHFTSKLHIFYERTPYRNHKVLGGTLQHVTRFISLANIGNPDKKQRSLYAFTINPMRHMESRELTQQPPAVTDSPYQDIVKEAPEPEDEQNFFYDPQALAAGRRKRQQQQQHGGEGLLQAPPTKRNAPPAKPRGPCWFCLGSPQVEKHLIVAIGNHSYLALPKGGLVKEHVLILPIGHYNCALTCPKEVLDELDQFKQSLRTYFHSKKQSCIVFERNWKSQHLQLQVVPVDRTDSGALRQAFIDNGKRYKIEFTEVPTDVDPLQAVPPGTPYFMAEFDDGPTLISCIKGHFPLQFGREVLASPLILNTPNRVDWKACIVSKDQETAMTQSLRIGYQPYDFTNEQD